MQEANEVPKLCHVIEQKLCLPEKEVKSSLRNFLTSEEFVKWVVEDIGIRLNEDERKVSVEYLDSSGIVSNQSLIIPCYYCLDRSGCVIMSSVHSSLRPTSLSACRLRNLAKCH